MFKKRYGNRFLSGPGSNKSGIIKCRNGNSFPHLQSVNIKNNTYILNPNPVLCYDRVALEGNRHNNTLRKIVDV